VTAEARVTESEFLSQLRAVVLASNRAWNEGNFARSYATLPDDFEYELTDAWPQARPLRGRAEVIAFFEDFHETFPDTKAHIREFIEAGPQTVIIGYDVTGTGRSSGAGTTMEIWQVWEVGDGLVPRRVTEFHGRELALEAAGLDPGEAGE
jgi:ketosteroid isomerase-like protein